jgi:hypothetical protein
MPYTLRGVKRSSVSESALGNKNGGAGGIAKNMLKACFSSSLRSDRSLRSRPKSAAADFVEQGFRMPIRLRHPFAL